MSTESAYSEEESESSETSRKRFSYFDYRVLLTDQGDYEIRDVYYDTSGEVVSWGSEANGFVGEDLEDLATGIGFAVRAMAKPILVESELPGYTPEEGLSEVSPQSGANLRAIITSLCVATTLGDISRWVEDLANFGVDPDTYLLDGAQVRPEGGQSLLEFAAGIRDISLKDLNMWLAHLYRVGRGREDAVIDGEDLAIDLSVAKVSPIECGNCDLLDVVVDVHNHDKVVLVGDIVDFSETT